MHQFHIDFKGDLDDIEDSEKNKISETLTKFLEKYTKEGEEAFLRLTFSKHKEQFRQKPLYFCKMGLEIQVGRFNSQEEGWGAEQAVNKNLDQLKKQIAKKLAKFRKK